jgi:hypothetical protein
LYLRRSAAPCNTEWRHGNGDSFLFAIDCSDGRRSVGLKEEEYRSIGEPTVKTELIFWSIVLVRRAKRFLT